MTGHPRSVPRKPLDASLYFWPLYLVFPQKNFKQLKCYRSHMIYEVNEPSLRALMKTQIPGARREGRPWGHTALPLTAARRKPHGPSPVPCQTQSHVTSMWTTSEGGCRSQPSVDTVDLLPWRGGAYWWERGTPPSETECLGSRRAVTTGKPSQDPVPAAPTVPGAELLPLSLSTDDGTRMHALWCSRQGEAARPTGTSPLHPQAT